MNEDGKNSISFDSKSLTESETRFNLLYEVGLILASLETMNEAAPRILEIICRNLRFDLGELWCLGKNETTLKLQSVWHLPLPHLERFAAESRRFEFPAGEGLPGKVLEKNAPVWIENLRGEANMPRRFFAEETGLQSGFAFPIQLGEKFLGTFSFFSTESRRADDALLQMFAAIGNSTGQFAKRESTESHLRASEDRYRAFIEQSTEGIWRFELDEKFSVKLPIEEQLELVLLRGYLAECNDAMARMYGLERAEELVGARITDLLDMSDAANIEYVRAFIESGYNLTDAESHEKDAHDNDKYFLNSLVGTIENDFLIRVWGTQRDVTEQKQSEKLLRESEENFRAFVQASSQAIWTTDTKGQSLEAFGWWENQTGQTREQSAGAGFLEAIHPHDRRRIAAVWQNAIATVKFFEAECRIINREGEYQNFAIRGVPVFNTDKHFRQWIGTLTDITEQKRAEQSLIDNEERYRALVEATSTVVWRANAQGELNFVGSFWEAVSGQQIDEILGSGWLAALHPDDREKTLKIWRRALIEKTIYETEFRVLTTANEYHWFAVRGVPILNKDGSVREWVGANTDINERKLAEEKIRESEARFRQMADHAPVMVWVTDATGYCNYLSQSWYDFTGQTPEIGLGFGWLDATHPDDVKQTEEIFLSANERHESFRVEYRLRRADGAYFWAIDSAQPRFGDDGNFLGYIGSVIDITERKQAESRLALLAEISELTRTLEVPEYLLFEVSKAVGEHLEVKRCLFNEIDLERDLETVHRDYCRGVPSVSGLHRISGYSPITSAEMQAGKTVVNSDSKTDPRTAQDYEKSYQPNGERAYITVPMLRKNQWVASLWVSDDEPREWSRQEISMLETIAERTWTAIEKLRINEALRESEEQYRKLFETMDEGFCLCEMITDANGEPADYRFLETNPAFERMTGLSNAVGKTALELVPNLEKYWIEIYGGVVLTGETVRFEEGSKVMDRWFDVCAARVGGAGNRQFTVLFNDITERKKIEVERERLLAREQSAREIAEEANHAKDEFIALVSHELRSPLNAMLGWTRILQNQKPDEKTKDYALEVIVRNARSQSRLIEDLLDIARVGKGKLRVDMQPTELIPIINAAVEIIKPTAEASGIEFSQKLDRAADFITGDADRLRQVIDNLLSNAVKFTASGGKVHISLEREANHAKITVSDTGQGITPDFLPQIFERFKQADPSTTRRHGGLGIGLSLARDLVELHSGTISAESAGENKGSTFIVTLPLRRIAPINENSGKVGFMDSQGKLSGFWILAVDDEADARELVSFMLQINGAKVTTANSAVEALDILKNSGERLPDILLSDISMPNESGYALLEKIRALPREHGGQIPAVALTAFNRPEDREAAFEAGFQKHLGKPVEPEDLISAIIETASAK